MERGVRAKPAADRRARPVARAGRPGRDRHPSWQGRGVVENHHIVRGAVDFFRRGGLAERDLRPLAVTRTGVQIAEYACVRTRALGLCDA
jgi:hypothetical protein